MTKTRWPGIRRLAPSLPFFTGAALAVAFSATVQAGRPDQPGQRAPRYAPDRVIVRYKAGTSAASKSGLRVRVHGERKRAYDLVPETELLSIPAGGPSVAQVVQELSQQAAVEFAEPDYVVEAIAVPNDPQYANLWGLNDTATPDADINAAQAWDLTAGDPNMVVAIIDSGIDYNHPDLAANIWTNPGEIPGNKIDDDKNGYVDDVHGYDFVGSGDADPLDDNGHGTHTAGTIGAVGNNGIGVAGVNWHVKLMALKFLDANGSGYTSDAVEALQYATRMGVKVSNNSWGGGGYSQTLYDAINAAKAVGHLFVAAAGNSGTNNDTTPAYPASYTLDNVIAVAAIDGNAARASFSNYGAASVDLGAPGVNILSTTPNNNYSYYSGTSMATPHVAGAAALLYGGCSGFTYGEVRDLLLANTRPLAALADKTFTGGALDLNAAAVGAMTAGCFTPNSPPQVTIVAPAEGAMVAGKVTVTATALDDRGVRQVQFFLDGTSIASDTNGADGWSAVWDTTKAANRVHTLTATATDTLGQTGSDSNAVTVANALATTIHIGDLDATAVAGKSNWTANLTLSVHDATHTAVAGVTVAGAWSGGATGKTSCKTNTSGQCTLSKGRIDNRQTGVTWSVGKLTKTGVTYVAGANHDPDGDSTGSVILVKKP